MIDKSEVKRRTTVQVESEIEDLPRISDTLKYHFVVDGEKNASVPKNVFTNIGYKKWTIRYWVSGDKFYGNSSLEESISVGMTPKASVTRLTTVSKKKKTKPK